MEGKRVFLFAFCLTIIITQVTGSAECSIKRRNDYELCEICTIINGETMINEDDFIGNSSGTVTIIEYHGTNTLPFIPTGLFKLYRMINDVTISYANFKHITSKTFENAKRLWWLTLSDTKSLETIAPDALNDCQSLEYLSIYNHSLKTLNFQYSFPILRQLYISTNPLEAVNRTWYQNLPNASIFFDFNTCVNTTGLTQAHLYKIPGEPRFEKCFANFDNLAVQEVTTELITEATTSQVPLPTYSCKFQNHRTFGYTCVLSNVTSDDFTLTGTHLSGKTDSDVTGVVILRSKISKIPQIIFNRFLKLKFLDASNVGIVQADSTYLKNCGDLKYLDLSDNDIITIKDGFLENCKALETVFIENNLINSISPCNNFMKSLENLVEVSLSYNICIDENGYFYNENMGGKYQETFVKPLMPCFTNFLDPPVAPVLLRRRVKST